MNADSSLDVENTFVEDDRIGDISLSTVTPMPQVLGKYKQSASVPRNGLGLKPPRDIQA